MAFDEEIVLYNEEKFITEMDNDHHTDVNLGAQLYRKLKTSANLSFTEARTEILKIACKVDYLNRMICQKGQLPIDELYNEVKSEFESTEALEKFIFSMVPIFLYIPGKQNPRSTSDGFRRLVFHITGLLLENKEVTESNIHEIILSIILADSPVSGIATGNTFKHHEFYLDFKGLRCLAAQVPCFNYNKEAKKIELVDSPNFEKYLALRIDVLRPRDIPRRDMSRRFCCNAVITKVYNCFMKGRILGSGKLSKYGIYILSKFLEGGQAEFESLNLPAKSFVSAIGAITPDDTCQVTVQRLAPTVVGWKMFDVKNHWGDIKDDKMIYSPTNFDVFPLPNVQKICEDYDRDLFIKRVAKAIANIGEDSLNFENVLREMEKQAKESQHQYETWKKRQDQVLGPARSSMPKIKKLPDLDPAPKTFQMNSEMTEKLRRYMSDIGKK